jgi:hypothetical protein
VPRRAISGALHGIAQAPRRDRARDSGEIQSYQAANVAGRKGAKFGRPAVLDASQKKRIAERYPAGEAMAELAREYERSEPTI